MEEDDGRYWLIFSELEGQEALGESGGSWSPSRRRLCPNSRCCWTMVIAMALSSGTQEEGGGGASTSHRFGGRDTVDQDMSIEELLLQVLEFLELVLDKVRLDTTMAGILKNPSAPHHRLSDSCFRILYGLVSRPQHGDQSQAAIEVMRVLVPMVFLPLKSPTRSAVLGFLTHQLAGMARENGEIRKTLLYLPRYLAMKAPDKSEPRASAVDAIVEILRIMESEDQVAFVEYVNKMAQGKAQLRFLAVDLILSLLTTLPNPLGVDSPDNYCADGTCTWWGIRCLQALFQRCSDVSAVIRARALTNLAHAIGSLSENINNHPCCKKAAVRKATLLLVTKYTLMTGQPIDEIILKTIGRACSDPLISIRKAAASALSEAYRKFKDSRVIKEWLHAVPPLIMDNETSIQEECENLFLELVLNWISAVGNAKIICDPPNLESVYSQDVLALLRGTCDFEVAPYVKKICASLGKKRKLKNSIATSLQNIITISESIWTKNSMRIEKWTAPPGAWFILSEISPFVSEAINWKFLHHHWELLDQACSMDMNGSVDKLEPTSVMWAGDRVSLLQTISNVSRELPSKPAAEWVITCLIVDAHVKALTTLCKRKATNNHEGDALVLKWVGQVLFKALETLEYYIGEVSRIKMMKKETTASPSLSQAVVAVFTIGSMVLVCPSADLKGAIPKLHAIIIPPDTDQKRKELTGLTVAMKEIAPSLYIQSWVTMGKICLVDDKLAKRYIPLFVQELERTESAALRNNIMISMTDFCVRYTALVDCDSHNLCCSPIVDKINIVRLLHIILWSNLVRDYVKWKGVLFRRFLLTLVDESEKIRHLADHLLEHHKSFIEAIFVLNDCRSHSGHCESYGNSPTSSQLFSIRGSDEKSRAQRMRIYVSLLKQMAPEQLLATSAKLCAEILAAVPDGLLNIDDAAGSPFSRDGLRTPLQDALRILACKEMRLQHTRVGEPAEAEEEAAADGGAGAAQAAKGRAVTQASKKNLIQHAVPIFIELKRLLESKNSPLTGSLMECLCVLLKDYKSEIEDILVADRQLQKELVYDMHKYDATRAKSRLAGADGAAGERVASAVADAAARATVRSVLKEAKRDAPTPPLSAMSLPKVRSAAAGGGATGADRPRELLESLRKRQSFDSDDDDN
ncbi:unnamed protein product [Spirodela intermedia]|uniref:Uncharacterized protein n=1 Tax=Spirodela intermedia TaxID=51605 RepID=A0A7I8IVM1_SPIIN|nr:unnamed protein product [Spirodela intermedia]CAA6662046.1 unnamed protein product [Spirodela intermedia]